MAATAAIAQGWQWPWSQPQQPPVPREPIYRGPPAPAPAPGLQPGPGSAPLPYAQQRGSICLQLEQRLAAEARGGNTARDVLPKLETDIRQLERTVQSGTIQLERAECFEYFLFAKSLKRTRQCFDLNTQVEGAKRQLADLQTQRQQLVSSQGRSYQDEIIRELARNNCGPTWQQEAQKRSGGNPFSSLWQDDEGGPQGGGGNQFGNLPFATYRTVCVRLCDGYFFPISFSTLENHFQRDADACQSKCAAPVELYYHANPGGAMEQALSVKSRQPYTSLRSAFRYRKEFVQGCSCKQAEYVPTPERPGDRRAEAAPPPQQPPQQALSPTRR
jgi:hypothetical protein